MPRTLKPILTLREQLKARAKELPPAEAVPYKGRQTALKWMLVTCFGYLGYKNAHFGRIEAHEAVTAHGRDKLLTAKEISEAAGYTVLHGLTDCLWLQKVGVADTGWRENDPSFCWRRRPAGAAPAKGAGSTLGSSPPEKNPPRPPFSKGGSSPPLGQGGLGGFEGNVEPPPSAIPAPAGRRRYIFI